MFPGTMDNPVCPETKTKGDKRNPRHDNTVNWCYAPNKNAAIWCRKSTDVIILLPEMILYPEPGNNIISWYGEAVNSILTKSPKYKTEVNIIIKLVGLILYIFDLGTDSYCAYKYVQSGDYIWAAFTVAFTVAPMLMTSIFATFDNIGRGKYLWALGTLVGAPCLPFGILAWSAIRSIRSYPDEDFGSTGAAGLIKMCDTLLESYPQAAIQFYFVFQTILLGDPIQSHQWFTIATSIMSLTFAVTTAISTLDDDIEDAAPSSRIIWFVCGLLAVVSRLVVASVYSMTHSLLWFAVIGTEFTATIIAWSIIRCCRCSVCTQLHEGFHSCPVGTLSVPLTWLLTNAFNSFTFAGLAVSTVNFIFSVGAFFLPGSQFACVVAAFVVAFLSCFANVVLVAMPRCKVVRDDWKRIDDGTRSSLLY